MTQLDSSRGEAAEGLPTAAELLSKRRKRRTVEPTEIVAIKPQRTIVFSDIPAPPPSTPAPSAPEVSVEAARTTDATAPTEPNARNSWVNVNPNEEVSDDAAEGEAVDDAVLEVVAGKRAETPPVPSVPPRPARVAHAGSETRAGPSAAEIVPRRRNQPHRQCSPSPHPKRSIRLLRPTLRPPPHRRRRPSLPWPSSPTIQWSLWPMKNTNRRRPARSLQGPSAPTASAANDSGLKRFSTTTTRARRRDFRDR